MKNFMNYICLFLMIIGINVRAFAEDQTWTYTFKNPDAISNNSITVNNATWTFATTSGYGSPTMTSGNSNGNYGLKFGNGGSNYYGSVTFSTDYFTTCKVKSVTVNLLNNSGDNGTLTVTQNTTQIGTQSLSSAANSWRDLTANTNMGDGGTLSITYSIHNAFYVHSITVNYEKSTTPSVVTLSEAGVSRQLEGSYVLGDMCDLPTTSTQQCGSKVFVGWSSTQITSPTDRPTESFYPIGTAVQLNKTEETFYAVYADAEGTEKIWEVTSIDKLIEDQQGYAAYDGEHTIGGYIYQSSNVWQNGGKIQFKSNQGYIYNKTEMPNISKIEITTDVTAWIVKEGNAENPSTGTQINIQYGEGKQTYVFSTKNGYFYIAEKSGNASDVSSIKVTFGVAYSNYMTSTFTLTYAAGGGTGDVPANVEGAAQGDIITLAAPAGLKNVGSVFQGWKSNVTDDNTLWKAGQEYTMPAQDVTMTAQWLAVTNYQTYCPRTVTFDLNGLQGEAPAPILTKKNLTITAPSDPVTPEGITFLGWYNGDTKWNFETDVVTEDMQLSAKCQSALVISGDVHLTSGKDVQVYTTPATNNMITVSWFGKDEPLATKIRFSYYLNGEKVTDTQSPFRVCNADNYNMVSGNINNEGDNFDQTFAVSYKPTAYDQLDNYTIHVEAVNDAGTQVYRTADLAVYGRSLPEQFVMVIKKTTGENQGWYAVPNVLATSSSAKAEDMPMPLLVEVNDDANPTFVKPSDNATNALYTVSSRNTISNNRGGVRLKSVANGKFMTATTTDNNSFYMPEGNSEDNQPFYLTSGDFGAYKVTLNPALYENENNTPTRWISMFDGKIAWYKTTACNVYFLPVITELIDVADEETKNLSDYGVNENTTIIVHAGGILNANKQATVGTLQIERADGKSGQVFETETLTANNAYFDLTLNATAMKWYDIAVPFKVDRLNGLSFPNGGTFPLNDVLVYNGATRATNGTNGSAWQYQDDGDLVPGVGYDIMFATNVTTVRFTKKAGAQLNNEEEQLAVNEFSSSSLLDANWNYIANNTLHYVNLGFGDAANEDVIAQTYNPGADNYTAYTQAEATYLVGTPFFVQVATADNISWKPADETPTILRAPAMTTNRVERFTVELSANGEMNDRLFVSADENARNEYQIGKDVAKMGVSSTIAQMWVENYNTKLCANEAVLFNDQATFPLGVFVPKNGEYTLAITNAPNNAELYLTEDGQPIWNLSKGAYTTEWAKGTHSEYGLMLQVTDAKAPTNLNGLNGSDKAVKFLKNSDIYILRNAKLYNAQGQLVK